MSQVLYRNATDDDFAFILKSWLKTYRLGKFASELTNEVFFANHKKVIAQLYARSNTVIVCDKEDPTHILGYCCFSIFPDGHPLFHFIYIKQTYRGFGLARALIKALEFPENGPRYSTHANRVFHAVKDRYKIEYNPYLLSQVIAGTL